MKIPIISDYIARKREEALAEIKRFREYLSVRNNPSDIYTSCRQVMASVDESNPITAAIKMKQDMREAFPLGLFRYLIMEIDVFQRMSPEEKETRAREEKTKHFKEHVSAGLERWVEVAEPLVRDIIEEDPMKVVGITYLSHISQEGGGEKIYVRVGKGEGKKLDARYFSGYGDMVGKNEVTSGDLAKAMLMHVLPRNNGYLSPVRYSNRERNRIVREIRKRTGRDLKKEVACLRNIK